MCPRIVRIRKKKAKPEVEDSPQSSLISFSHTAIERLQAGPKDYYRRDSKTPGLNVKITPKGRKVFLLRYDMPWKRGRKLHLGVFPKMSVPEARQAAMEAWSKINAGIDPAIERAETAKRVTVADFAQRYLSEHVEVRLSKKAQRDYRSLLENIVVPKLGTSYLEDVKRADVERLHGALRDKPAQANRLLSVIKAMYNKAGDWGVLSHSENPAMRLKPYKEEARKRYFNSDEQRRISAAIKQLRKEYPASQSAFEAIQFMFRTGCRTSEALGLRWDDIDWEKRQALLRTSKTGPGELFLGDDAIELLQAIARNSRSEWVFPGRRLDKPLERIKRPWAKICELAELKDARPHDIRHTVGTFMTADGRTFSAQMVLRHTHGTTTERYTHAHFEAILRDLNQAVGAIRKNGL